MELKSINTRDGAEKGAFLHLKHPVNKHPLYSTDADNVDEDGYWDGSEPEPPAVGVTVRGRESRTVQRVAEKARKKRLILDPSEWNEDEDNLNFLCALIVEFHQIGSDGIPLTSSHEDKKLFLSQSDDLEAQVLEFSGKKENFFKLGANN